MRLNLIIYTYIYYIYICFTKSPAFFLLLVRWGQFDDFTCFNRLKAWNEK